MIDNSQLILNLLEFENPGDFYMLYVLKRKKDQPEGEKDNHQSVRTIKTYCIESEDHLLKRYEEIKQLCELFKARAYIHVQKQNHQDVSLDMLQALAQRIKNGIQNQKGLFDSVVGQIKTLEKRWIVDIDGNIPEGLEEFLQLLKPEGEKILFRIPTRNGQHLITKKFDLMEFSKHYPNIDIQKKNPTLLYYPHSLEEK